MEGKALALLKGKARAHYSSSLPQTSFCWPQECFAENRSLSPEIDLETLTNNFPSGKKQNDFRKD